ncbi:MAG TPA: hypothetical protein VJ302_34345 [Blastocatellia bacterium]|nr:hypothetical protein [Blastocatellia bacterium]
MQKRSALFADRSRPRGIIEVADGLGFSPKNTLAHHCQQGDPAPSVMAAPSAIKFLCPLSVMLFENGLKMTNAKITNVTSKTIE